MVPSGIVSLEALPLTPNGKVDRQALPDPGQARLTESADFVPPRGPVEEMVASGWGSLLGVERVGAHDNFFDLGGHSLLATQVVSRLREAFGVEIPLRALFEFPTVAGLAAQIESMKRVGASSDLAPIEPTRVTVRCLSRSHRKRCGFSISSLPDSRPSTSLPPCGSWDNLTDPLSSEA